MHKKFRLIFQRCAENKDGHNKWTILHIITQWFIIMIRIEPLMETAVSRKEYYKREAFSRERL